jgi:hypothetical protein
MNAMRKLMALAAASAILSGGCFAKTSATPVAVPSRTFSSQLRQGTEVRLKTISPLSSKFSKIGERFELLTTEDVRVNNQIVVPAGTRGVGEVTKVEKKGAFGKSGKLDTRVVYLALGDQRIAMTGQSHEAGASGTVGTVAAVVLVGVFSAFVTGKSAEYPAGTAMVAYVENDTSVTVR